MTEECVNVGSRKEQRSFSQKTPRRDGGNVCISEKQDIVEIIYFSILVADGWRGISEDSSIVAQMYQLKNAIFWDVTPCCSCKNRRFGGTYRFLRRSSVVQLLVITNIVASLRILFTHMKEALLFSETSVLNNSHTASHPRRQHYS
jgi:hypothetical protein